MFGDTATRVLLAVVRQDRPTVRSVAFEVGRSVNATHKQLQSLRAAGLVEWDDGKQGTLRAVVTPVTWENAPSVDRLFGPGVLDSGPDTSGPGAALTARDLADTGKGCRRGER